MLIHKLRPAIAKKQPELLRKGPILLHDGARPHIADVVKEQLMDWGWEVLDHPPYSPDISPCDFHLFPLMKEPLRGIRFESVEDINDAVFHGLQELRRKDWMEVFQTFHRDGNQLLTIKGNILKAASNKNCTMCLQTGKRCDGYVG